MQTFDGYRRPDGLSGVRNHVAVISTVSCANVVAQQIERAVPGVVAVTHEHGCSQVGADLQQTVDTLVGVGRNPNVFATLVVSLGCEAVSAVDVAGRIAQSGKPTELITIQEAGGSTNAVEAGKKIVRRFLRMARQVQKEPCPMSDLILALECGGSDGWSGITANPALGRASDLLVAAGGTALLAETPELIGAEHLMNRPGSNPEAVQKLYAAIAAFENEVRRLGVDPRGAQPTPGNMAGGLTTIEEKSLGAMMKGGSTPLVEFVRYAQPPTRHGLVMMDTPGNDVTAMSAQVAGGAQVMVFTTGRGTPTGTPVTPCIKVSTNSAIYQRMRDNIDLDAGTIITEGESLDSVGRRIYDEVAAVANGKLTRAEILGHREFAICRIGLTF
jgi:altronate dehydratase large subunit